MAKRKDPEGAALLQLLCDDPSARLLACEGGYRVSTQRAGSPITIDVATVRRLRASGLLSDVAPGVHGAAPEARAWLKRRRDGGERSFRLQHGTVVATEKGASAGLHALVELDESPVAALARRSGKGGAPWLEAPALVASERLRRDFEIGQLRPRVTANWSASVSDGRRDGGHGGIGELTDMALAARLRFDRAVKAVGPELSGVLIDVCCFLKGLETVERERQWPARAAKLVLKLALGSLARHYGLTAVATGRRSGKLLHWGADDYRPEIT